MVTKKIAYITDIHFDEQEPKDFGVDARQNWEAILADLASRQVTEVIFGGDIGLTSSNKYFFDSLAAFDLKITLGNHDTFGEAVKHYSNKLIIDMAELYYSYSDSDFKYIFLDSSSAEISLPQFDWLSDQLDTDKGLIIFIHHPILKVDTVVDAKYPLRNRKLIYDLLRNSAKPVVIFCGHYHTDDRQELDNITQYITPAASYQVKKGTAAVEPHIDYFGYRMLYVTEANLSTELILFDAKNQIQ
jgi:hypothetical protein